MLIRMFILSGDSRPLGEDDDDGGLLIHIAEVVIKTGKLFAYQIQNQRNLKMSAFQNIYPGI